MERRIVHLRLPQAMRDGVRDLALEGDIKKQDVWDAICKWFLKHPLPRGSRAYEHPERRARYTTMWIESKLRTRLETVAERDQVPVARVIHTAAARYLRRKKMPKK